VVWTSTGGPLGVCALAEGWSYKNHSLSPFCPIFIGQQEDVEEVQWCTGRRSSKCCTLERRMVGNTILWRHLPWVAKMIFHHSKPSEGGRWVSFYGKYGWLVCLTLRWSEIYIMSFEDKYWYWILHQRHKRRKWNWFSSLLRYSLSFDDWWMISIGYLGVKSYLEKGQHRTTTIYDVELQ